MRSSSLMGVRQVPSRGSKYASSRDQVREINSRINVDFYAVGATSRLKSIAYSGSHRFATPHIVRRTRTVQHSSYVQRKSIFRCTSEKSPLVIHYDRASRSNREGRAD